MTLERVGDEKATAVRSVEVLCTSSVPHLRSRRLKQLEHVREDPNGQREVDRPRTQVQKPSEQHKRPDPVRLAEEHLQDDGELLGGATLFLAEGEPDLEGG